MRAVMRALRALTRSGALPERPGRVRDAPTGPQALLPARRASHLSIVARVAPGRGRRGGGGPDARSRCGARRSPRSLAPPERPLPTGGRCPRVRCACGAAWAAGGGRGAHRRPPLRAASPPAQHGRSPRPAPPTAGHGVRISTWADGHCAIRAVAPRGGGTRGGERAVVHLAARETRWCVCLRHTQASRPRPRPQCTVVAPRSRSVRAPPADAWGRGAQARSPRTCSTKALRPSLSRPSRRPPRSRRSSPGDVVPYQSWPSPVRRALAGGKWWGPLPRLAHTQPNLPPPPDNNRLIVQCAAPKYSVAVAACAQRWTPCASTQTRFT